MEIFLRDVEEDLRVQRENVSNEVDRICHCLPFRSEEFVFRVVEDISQVVEGLKESSLVCYDSLENSLEELRQLKGCLFF